MTTQQKELLGKELTEESDILKRLFPDLKEIRWIENKEDQISGIDWCLTLKDGRQINLDLKVGIGDYTTCPIEISQRTRATNGKYTLTNTNEKKTDYFLYVLITGDIADFVLLPYKPIARECQFLYHDMTQELSIFPKRPIVHQSFNGSGYFIKFDYAEAISQHKIKDARAILGVNIK